MQRYEQAYFENFPLELVDGICSYLQADELAKFSRTNKLHYEICHRFWEGKVRSYFPSRKFQFPLSNNEKWKKYFGKFYNWDIKKISNPDLIKLYLDVAEGNIKEVEMQSDKLCELIGKDKLFYELMKVAAYNKNSDLLNLFFRLINKVYKEEFGQERNRALIIDTYGCNILHAAVMTDQPIQTISELIDTGLDIDQVDSEKELPASFLAIKYGRFELFKWLSEKSGKSVAYSHDSNYTYSWLHFAAECGQVSIIKFLIEKGFDINQKDENGLTALNFAVNYNHLSLFEFLLLQGARVREDEFLYVTFCENIQVLDVLYEKGARIDTLHCDGTPMLVHAASSGYVSLVKFLLSHGVDVNALGRDGHAINYICKGYGYGHNDKNVTRQILAYLLEYNPRVRNTENFKEEPIFIAVRRGKYKLVELLLPYYNPIELNTLFYNGKNLLHLAAEGINATVLSSKEKHYIKIVKLLIKFGMNFFQRDEGNNDVYYHTINPWAISVNDIENNLSLLDELIKIESQLTFKSDLDRITLKQTLLAKNVILANDEKLVSFLNKHHFSINAVNEQGQSILMEAIDRGSYRVAEKLLEINGVDLTIVDLNGKTAFDYACKNNEFRVKLYKKMIEQNIQFHCNDSYFQSLTHPINTVEFNEILDFHRNQIKNYISSQSPAPKNFNLISCLIKLNNEIEDVVVNLNSSDKESLVKTLHNVITALKNPDIDNIQRCMSQAELCKGKSKRLQKIAGITLMVCGALLIIATLAFACLIATMTLGISAPIVIGVITGGSVVGLGLAGTGLGLFCNSRRTGISAAVHNTADELGRPTNRKEVI